MATILVQERKYSFLSQKGLKKKQEGTILREDYKHHLLPGLLTNEGKVSMVDHLLEQSLK